MPTSSPATNSGYPMDSGYPIRRPDDPNVLVAVSARDLTRLRRRDP